MMARPLPGLIVILLLLSLVGCGAKEDDRTEGDTTSIDAGSTASAEGEGTGEAARQFGSATSGEHRAEAVAVIRDYFGALAMGHLRRACGHLARSYRSAAAGEGSGGRGGAHQCRTLAHALRGGAAADPDTARSNAAAEIVRVGAEGGTAVVVLRPEEGPTSFLTLVREGGSWKLTALTAAPLPEGAG